MGFALPGRGAFAAGGFVFGGMLFAFRRDASCLSVECFLPFGGTLSLRAFLRGGEAFLVAKAISPPRAPPLRPRNLLQVVGMCMFIGGAMDSTVLSVVRCADFYSLWTKCGLLGRPVSVVSWDLFCL